MLAMRNETFKHSFILADTAALHEKILILSDRVRQLEDALNHYDPKHPLLYPNLSQLKQPLEKEDSLRTSGDIAEDAIDAFGSLLVHP
jgi:hypothetical protein